MSLGVEDYRLEILVVGATQPAPHVELLRRNVPFDRDVFDRLIYRATEYCLWDGTWDTFVGSAIGYSAVMRSRPADTVPPLIPPDVAAAVADVMSRFPRRQRGEPIIDGHSNTTPAQEALGRELMFTLGGDHGDGVHAAGTRAYSKMMSARIGDGFVHPVIGGQIWSHILAASNPDPAAGKLVTVLPSVAAAVSTWNTSPSDRPRCERVIIDHAHTLGWRDQPPPTGRWFTEAPAAADPPPSCDDDR